MPSRHAVLAGLVPALLLSGLWPGRAPAQDARSGESFAEAYTAAWNTRDPERIAAFFAEDGVYEDVTSVANGWAEPFHGRPAIAEGIRHAYDGIPDMSIELRSVRAAGDLVVMEWTMLGTQTGDWPGLPATGRSFSVPGISSVELDDGFIRRQHDYWDAQLMLTQLGAGDGAAEASTTTPEENKEIVRRILDEGVNKADLDVFRETLAPDYARHSQATTAMPEIRGVGQMLTFLEETFRGIPDWHEEILLMVAEGDKVAYITRGTGTHTGPLGDLPPTGKKVDVMNYIFQRIEDGKIAETWIGWDNLAMLDQLGIMPPPGEAEDEPAPGRLP
jgi:steroid delta-isomerase-like uncharacterized protein